MVATDNIISSDRKKYVQLDCADTISAKLFHLNKAQLAVLIRELQTLDKEL